MTDKVIQAALKWAPGLHLESGSPIEPAVALLAVAEIETSGGARWQASKHEGAYCYGGRYHNRQLAELSKVWGCSAHESWGPWQILFITAAEFGFTGDPVQLRDPEISAPYVVSLMNRRVFDPLKGENLAQLFDAWNSGNPRDAIVPHEYIAKATLAYERLLAGRAGK